MEYDFDDVQQFDPNEKLLIEDGIHIYVGTTGSGKTFKAIHDLELLHATTNDRGAIVVDSASVPTLAHIPLVPTLREALERAYSSPPQIVRWIPSDDGGRDAALEFTRFMNAAREGGNLRILVDEISFWTRNPAMLKLTRVWRNSNVTLQFTGQHLSGDFGQAVLACNPHIYIFRLKSPAGIEFAEKWFNDFDREMNSTLGMGEFVERQF